MIEKYFKAEKKVSLYLKERSIPLLRYSLGIIYLWFGFLKVIGISPAEELVERATHWINVHNIVIVIGVWEMVIGYCLLFRRFKRIGLWLFFLHYPGIWLPVFLNPEDVFTVIPYGLTLEGQYVVKNLVTLAAALVLVGSLYKPKHSE